MSEAILSVPVLAHVPCTATDIRRIAAMLDIAPSRVLEDGVLPLGWHFPLLAGETRRSALRGDGFPGLGIEIPDLGLPRLLLAGRQVQYLSDIPIGSEVERRSEVLKINRKQSSTGPMAVVTLRHQLNAGQYSSPALVETQSYILLPAGKHAPNSTQQSGKIDADVTRIVTPNETMLFQYSALGFNSHKIHLDRDFARDVEGYPDLVVNGGLTTLLLIEFLVNDLGVRPSSLQTRHNVPLFCGRPITLAASKRDNKWVLCAYDEAGRKAVEMEIAT